MPPLTPPLLATLHPRLYPMAAPGSWPTIHRHGLRLLNARVFFWLTESRLETLLGAKAYSGRPHTILVIDTASLLAAHAPRVELSPINSGSTVYDPAPRGRDCFLPIADFPFDHWHEKRRSRKKAIAELTVLHSVPDLRDHVLEVYETGPPRRTLFSR